MKIELPEEKTILPYSIVDKKLTENIDFSLLLNIDKNIPEISKLNDICCISPYIFIKEMDKLGDKYGIFLPKGANYYVEDVGIKLVNKYGEKILHDIAKLNFSNTDRILKEVRK